MRAYQKKLYHIVKNSILLLMILCMVPAWADDIRSIFQNPPSEYLPGLILYRSGVRSEVTQQSITDTLSSCAKQGIGSIALGQLNDFGTGNEYHMSKNWKPRLKHFGEESCRLGLNTSIFIAPGWTGPGGPWIPLEQSQQQLVYGKTTVQGLQKIALKLPVPGNHNFCMGPGNRYKENEIADDYRDIAVIALKRPASAVGISSVNGADQSEVIAVGTNAAGGISLELQVGPSHTASVVLVFDESVSISSLFMQPNLNESRFPKEGEIWASEDGTDWSQVSFFRFPPESSLTVSFLPVIARYFKIVFKSTQTWNGWNGLSHPVDKLKLDQIVLLSRPQVNHLEWKNGGAIKESYFPDTESFDGVPADETVNLTSRMSADGVLSWNVPKGDWVILRIGHRCNRKFPHPAGPGRGYMADPLSVGGLRTHFNEYVKPYANRLGKLDELHLDSWESGNVNWTPSFPDEFRRRRGYDMTPYLPVLAGEVIGSSDVSERFLTDFRRTIADLIADRYYSETCRLANKMGVPLSAQAGPGGRISDRLMNFGRVDIPHTEVWIDSMAAIDKWAEATRIAASAKRAYGKTRVSAESFDTWRYFEEYPLMLKAAGDIMLAAGLNHFDLHVGLFQPENVGDPGMFSTFGSYFNAHNTYWSRFRPFMEYLSRCEYLLSEGVFQADVLYYAGDEPCEENIREFFKHTPDGYGFDFINTECLLNRLTVKDEKLVLGDGHYRLLVLPDDSAMRVEALRKVESLVELGAVILGHPPKHSMGLAGYPASEKAVREIADRLWSRSTVLSGMDVIGALKKLDVVPDWTVKGAQPNDFRIIHNRTKSRDVYFIANTSSSYQSPVFSFRVSGRTPSLWTPGDGQTSAVWDWQDDGSRIQLPLNMAPFGSVFVVFENDGRMSIGNVTRNGQELVTAGPAAQLVDQVLMNRTEDAVQLSVFQNGRYTVGSSGSVDVNGSPESLDLSKSWSVAFDEKTGIGKAAFPELISWTEHADERIKYYSGEAVYERSFECPENVLSSVDSVVLDLGELSALAEVRLNGKSAGVLWKPPYRLDVTEYLQVGQNRLEVIAVNTWFNRLFYETVVNPDGPHLLDLSKAPSPKVIRNAVKNRSLMPSGLFGPVRLMFGVQKKVGRKQ